MTPAFNIQMNAILRLSVIDRVNAIMHRAYLNQNLVFKQKPGCIIVKLFALRYISYPLFSHY